MFSGPECVAFYEDSESGLQMARKACKRYKNTSKLQYPGPAREARAAPARARAGVDPRPGYTRARTARARGSPERPGAPGTPGSPRRAGARRGGGRGSRPKARGLEFRAPGPGSDPFLAGQAIHKVPPRKKWIHIFRGSALWGGEGCRVAAPGWVPSTHFILWIHIFGV